MMAMTAMKYVQSLIWLTMLGAAVLAQAPAVEKVEPPNWWAGHSVGTVRLLVRGSGFRNAAVRSANTGLTVANVRVNGAGTYVFFDVKIAPETRAGKYQFELTADGGKVQVPFEISPLGKAPQTITNDDVIYLIMTDRFADGDASNNKNVDRSNPRMWHGGDLRGVINNLGYVKELGATAIWLTPWYDNSDEVTNCDKPWCPMASYHGYGAIDYYGVENHFGTMADLTELVQKANSMGIKVIQDQVANHVGFRHPWMKQAPLENWFTPFKQNKFNNSSLLSPNASPADVENTLKGWFDFSLPDLDQTEPEVARYEIQNALWWIGMTGISGIRQDTIQYMPRKFIRDWTAAINKQYPGFYMVGEVFEEDSAQTAFFQGGKTGWDGVDTGLPSVFDFKLWRTSQEVFTGKKPARALRDVLKYDGLYPDVSRVTVLANNHDTDRFMSLGGATKEGAKLHTAFVLATRGIPQLYYGEEVLMTGGHDPANRGDMAKFERTSRTADEQEMFDWTRRWIATRRQHPAMRTGRTIDVLYNENVYAFRRVTAAEDLLFIINSSERPQSVSFDRTEINAVNIGCYFDILIDLKTGMSPGGRCPDAGSSKVEFALEPRSITAVKFENLSVLRAR